MHQYEPYGRQNHEFPLALNLGTSSSARVHAHSFNTRGVKTHPGLLNGTNNKNTSVIMYKYKDKISFCTQSYKFSFEKESMKSHMSQATFPSKVLSVLT